MIMKIVDIKSYSYALLPLNSTSAAVTIDISIHFLPPLKIYLPKRTRIALIPRDSQTHIRKPSIHSHEDASTQVSLRDRKKSFATTKRSFEPP